jgi:hypothetical protein
MNRDKQACGGAGVLFRGLAARAETVPPQARAEGCDVAREPVGKSVAAQRITRIDSIDTALRALGRRLEMRVAQSAGQLADVMS